MLLLTNLLVVNENRGADQRRGFFSRKILCDICCQPSDPDSASSASVSV